MILIKYFSFAYQSNINGNIFLWFESLSSFALHNTSLFKHLQHCKLIFKRHFRKSKTFNKVNSERDCIFNQNSVAHVTCRFQNPVSKKVTFIKNMNFLLLLSAIPLCCDTFRVETVFGEKSDLYPKTSCLSITKVETIGQCFMRCLKAFEFNRMFSYSKDQRVCMCCVDLSGNDVIGYDWMTYVPRKYYLKQVSVYHKK